MKLQLTLQNPSSLKNIPKAPQFKKWISAALQQSAMTMATEITLRITNKKESAKLNHSYRNKTGATNVLAFPFERGEGYLGDIVICAPLVSEEAKQQQKNIMTHWAHLAIHGTLHLLGYDHIKSKEAKIMESLEINIMKQLGLKL